MPNGYNTIIGERGFRISGGQAQRLALARAFIKNAQILVLDEPTSQLDLKTELYLQEEMKKHFVERNVLVIAHRLNTIVDADKIVVLKEGRIVGEGIHMQLLENNPFYSSLFIKKGEN